MAKAGGVRRLARVVMALSLAGATVSGCVMNRVSGQWELSVVSPAQELAMGREGDRDIIAQYGRYDDRALTALVDRVGHGVARHSDEPDRTWHFRILDSAVVNAFALPGGYVYVTRGLLAYVENEAQLAMILGHEIGHVTARHAAERITRKSLTELGLQLGGLFIADLRPYLGLVHSGMELLFLSYSRANESAADELGVTYAARAGYAAAEGAVFFQTLERLEKGQAKGNLPSFLSTHPDPADRVPRIRALAAKARAERPGTVPKGQDPEAYLPALKGVVFGKDPRQGYERNGLFIHPGLAFQFPVPAGWRVQNRPDRVSLSPKSATRQATLVLATAKPTSPEAAADAFIAESHVTVESNQATEIHGLPARLVRSRVVVTRQGVDVPLAVQSAFIRKDEMLIAIHGYAGADTFATVVDEFQRVMLGFRPVTDHHLLAKQPKRVDVVPADRSGPFQSVVPAHPGSGFTVPDLAVLNQRQPDDSVVTGTLLKTVH